MAWRFNGSSSEEGRIEQIVFITGHGDIPMGIRAMKRGAVDFLPKPFRDDELLSAVAQALARSGQDWQSAVTSLESRERLAKAHATRIRSLPVGDRRAAQQRDRSGTRSHASHD